MDESLNEWLADYSRLSDALLRYLHWIDAKPNGYGPDMPEPERIFSDLWYYWSGALVNAGDVFGWMEWIIEHESAFQAIGALGTLAARDNLMPFYLEQQECQDRSASDKYWLRTRAERASAEALAEDTNDFARLLLAYAQKNFPEMSDE